MGNPYDTPLHQREVYFFMKDLMTRKIVLGLLMMLVLAFSVQGIAEALTITKSSGSGDLETKTVGSSFDIKFSVGLTGDTIIYDARRNRISDEDTPSVIDNLGFKLTDPINGTRYRESTEADQAGFRYEVTGDTGTPGNSPEDPDNNWIATTGAHVDASGNVVDAEGRAVYTSSTLSIRMTANPDSAVDKSLRFNYNDEAIAIGVSPATISLEMTSNGYPVTPITGVSTTAPARIATDSASATTASLFEMDPVRGLPSSITLRCVPTAAGTYTITIRDVTPTEDFPNDTAPPQDTEIFTLFAVQDTLQSTVDIIEPKDDSVHFAGETLQIDTYFRFYATGTDNARTLVENPSNVHLNYQVIEGPGDVYARTSDRDTTAAVKNLLTSTDADVYLNMKNGRNVIVASILGQDPNTQGAKIIFNYSGTGTSTTTTTTTTTTTQQQARLLIDVSGTGATRSVTVNAVNAAGISVPGILVTLGSVDFTLSQAVTTGTPVSITVPTTGGPYTIFARHPTNAYAPATGTVTVAAPALGTLTISPSGTAVNGVQNVTITLRTPDNTIPSGTVPVSLSGTGFSATSVPVTGGFAITGVVLPVATGTYTLNATATGYDPASIRLTVGTPTTTPTTPTTPTTRGPAGTPSSIRIASEPFPSGTANRQLAQPLSARVLDANGNGVASVRVTFQVVSGQGRLSQRGNGRAVRVNTDRNGNARANYTPLADGTSTVRATAAGVTQTVTFTITAGAAAPSTDDTTPRDTGTTTPRTEINPDVHVRAAQRPPMLWVDGGKIYALVGADVEEFGSGVEGAMNITVGGGKVYWTEMTGESSGTINSAKLDGSGVKELKKIKAVPMGIAVDTAGDKLYWTNSRGRIQSADLDGSGIENVWKTCRVRWILLSHAWQSVLDAIRRNSRCGKRWDCEYRGAWDSEVYCDGF